MRHQDLKSGIVDMLVLHSEHVLRHAAEAAVHHVIVVKIGGRRSIGSVRHVPDECISVISLAKHLLILRIHLRRRSRISGRSCAICTIRDRLGSINDIRNRRRRTYSSSLDPSLWHILARSISAGSVIRVVLRIVAIRGGRIARRRTSGSTATLKKVNTSPLK